jgi:hypothetical protein
MMSFQSRPRGTRPRPGPRADAPAAETPAVAPENAPAAANDMLPGWHASSMDLRDGLEVTEHASLDSLPPEWADTLTP